MKVSTKNLWVAGLCSLCAGAVTSLIFGSYFIKVSIDYLSFIAGIFLVIDAAHAFYKAKNASLGSQFARAVRFLFGSFIIKIHLGQFLHYRVMSSQIAEIKIDWVDYVAISASIFLMAEGLTRILRSGSFVFPGQISRLFRILIGAIVLTIHILQLVHCWGIS
ncbi:MAG: hypothetical protein WCV56_05130 [Candidatus Omnitrophota bacterium]